MRIEAGRTGWTTRLDKYIYAVIFAGLVVFMFCRTSYVNGLGQIVLSVVPITYPQDVRITGIPLREGDVVRKGQLLFTFREERSASLGYEVARQRSRQAGVADVARMQADVDVARMTGAARVEEVRKEIEGKERELAYFKALSAARSKDLERIKKLALLNVETGADVRRTQTLLDESRAEEIKLAGEIAALQETMKVAVVERDSVVLATGEALKTLRVEADALMREREPFTPDRPFLSPFDGTVSRIRIQPAEVALGGVPIMDIYRPGSLMVNGFFRLEDAAHIAAGRKAVVEFADGSKSHGRIVNVTRSVVPLPPDFQNPREPVRRYIMANIELPPRDLTATRGFDRMTVNVYVPRGN